MRAEKEAVKCHEASREELDLLRSFIACYATPEPILDRYIVVSCKSREGAEMLIVEPSAWRFARATQSLFTVGLHVASVRNGSLLPHLSLGLLLEDVVTRGYIMVTEHVVKLLTYGRDVVATGRDVIEYVAGCEPMLALNVARRFVAWVRVKTLGRDKLLIKPLIDVGWYLRSGV